MSEPKDTPKAGALTLLLEITRCPNVQSCLVGALDHPCHAIVTTQRTSGLEGYQLPEPWSGALDQAPILFLSSNPSINTREDYPRWTWKEDLTADFFAHRFGGGKKAWVKDGLHTLLQDGTYKTAPVRFWASVRARATELLERDSRPGIDYAMSEVVHCKSEREIGVWSAANECAQRWLPQVVEAAGAKVVVVLGKIAEKAVCKKFGIAVGDRLPGRTSVGPHQRQFVFLPHPNSRVQRTLATCLTAEQLRYVRELLK